MVLVAGVFGLVAAVYWSGALDHVQRQEAGHGGEHDHWHAEQVLWLLAESLGQQIEQHHAEHQPRSQAQHQVPAITDTQRGHAAKQRSNERPESDQDGHRGGSLLISSVTITSVTGRSATRGLVWTSQCPI